MPSDNTIRSEDAVAYLPGHNPEDEAIVARALDILATRMRKPDILLADPSAAAKHLCLHIGDSDEEVFVALFLDSRHRLLACESMFFGTVDGAEVHPRVVVKRALQLNACALIVGHNHPSGNIEPSAADRAVTARLKQALMLVDVRLLDHFVVSGDKHTSLASRGWV